MLLLILVVATELMKTQPVWIEHWYSGRIFPVVSGVQRALLGRLPFSAGDLLLVVVYAWFIVKGAQLIWVMYKWRRNSAKWKRILKQITTVGVSLYVLFYVLWGFNYYRLGSAYQLQIQPAEYTAQSLDTLFSMLNARLLKLCHDSASIEKSKRLTNSQFTLLGIESYRQLQGTYSFLQYRRPSIKSTAIPQLLSYMGTMGYANPYTGEAQINYLPPVFQRPFTITHEMAHQLGYGSESEANLIGYLACRSSSDSLFRYSVYGSLQGHTLRELYRLDSSRALQLAKLTPHYLQTDREAAQRFWEQYKNPLDPLIYKVYDWYLKINNQPMGQQSYNYVVAWLVGYARKYGWEAL
jgi:hypothetical protein